MRVIFTCGGTGGHINPALAVAKLLRGRKPDSRILFIGANGMEKDLVPREGFEIEQLEISNYIRSVRPADLMHNIRALDAVRRAKHRAAQIIEEFRPDVILGTGGYASFPALYMGTKMHIPTAVHESNAVPGLATKLVADRVDRILVNYAESASQYRNTGRVVPVGVPVQEEFIFTDRVQARRRLGVDERPLIVSAWGSLGAREMNKTIVEFMKLEAEEGLFQHIHATGSFGWKWMPTYAPEQGLRLEEHPQIRMREYFYNMPTMLAAADLVLARAGASSISEIVAAGVPCILIPSPNVTNNHQEKNARVIEARGAAKVLLEQDCDGASLYAAAKELLLDKDACGKMRKSQHKIAVTDSAERIYDILCVLAKSR